jgi:two-component system, response regulator RegA
MGGMFSGVQSILVVDDDQALSRSIALALDRGHSHVFECTTAAQAVQELEQGAYDVVLLDLSLPDGDAFDVLDKVAERSPTPAVVAISGVATPLDSFRLGQLGAASFVAKPFSTDELVAAIEQALCAPVRLKPHIRGVVGKRSVHELQEEVRDTMVEEALARAHGSRTRAAALLGVSRQVLQFMLRRKK